MKIPHITNATVTEPFKIDVEFSDGSKRKYDPNAIIAKHESYSVLKEYSFFQNVTIESGGYALSWNNDIDIAEYEIWKNGVKI